MSSKNYPLLTATKARQSIKNAVVSGVSGALGAGDRGYAHMVPQWGGNPYDFTDYISRWRQYVHLYMTSWEARKIVRLPVEDALRKDWVVEDMPEEMQKVLNATLTRLRFNQVLSRSMMLERLLGGCLTFLGVEDAEDNPKKPLHPKTGQALRFLNAIPISRIARMNWCHEPLSEHYNRPEIYLINGQDCHVSRFLVWDGDPLFDPYDFALTNFRSNLAGFGPSVLATVWDDIVKAIGTRQAAYQLIQTNNAILMAVNDLQDLSGTKSGVKALAKLKEIANNISVYRAALIDGDKVDIKQNAASFGSVPELIITYIQVLAAASDIPATRFLGQAPGGLNATGESDLENYYNMIDSIQRQRVEPAIRRVYDIVGYEKFPSTWGKVRDKYEIKFPPLWNASELEEAQKNGAVIDNALKLHENGMMSDEKFIEEINSKGALSVTLDEQDLALADDLDYRPGQDGGGTPPAGPGQPPTPGGRTIPPQNGPTQGAHAGEQGGQAGLEPGSSRNATHARFAAQNSVWSQVIAQAGHNPADFDLDELEKGIEIEREHIDTVGGDEQTIIKIALDHLAERPDYYSKLAKMEAQPVENARLKNGPEQKTICVDFDGVIADYSNGFQGTDVFGELIPGAKRTLDILKADGWKIIIFTCREDSIALRNYLFEHQIPYDLINVDKGQIPNGNPGKPNADVYLDDKAVRFTSWQEAAVQILSGQYANRIHLEHLPAPTPAQTKSGNYKKHHLKLHGLDMSIENPFGSERKGIDKDGNEWSSILPAHYGYIKKTEGADGDHVDVFVGPHEDSELVFVVDQVNPDTGEFDEHKCIFGAMSVTQAKALYLSAFSDRKGELRIGSMAPMHVSGFKQWLKEGDTKLPYSNAGKFKEEEHPRANDGKFGSGGKGGKESATKPEPEAPAPKGRTKAPTQTPEEKEKHWQDFLKTKTPADAKAFQTAREQGWAVPPAWTELKVNTAPGAEWYVKGRDEKGRVVGQYSAAYRAGQDAKKFNRVKNLTKIFPKLSKDLASQMETSEEAAVLYLISKTGFRPGSDSDTKADVKAFGASTLRGTHVTVEGDKTTFKFIGKKGVSQEHVVTDQKIADMVKPRVGQDVPIFNTTGKKVLGKMKELAPGFVVKDLRTYVGTATALATIKKLSPPKTPEQKEKMIMSVAAIVAKKLGNSPAMARKAYIDPTVFKQWEAA